MYRLGQGRRYNSNETVVAVRATFLLATTGGHVLPAKIGQGLTWPCRDTGFPKKVDATNHRSHSFESDVITSVFNNLASLKIITEAQIFHDRSSLDSPGFHLKLAAQHEQPLPPLLPLPLSTSSRQYSRLLTQVYTSLLFSFKIF